MKRDGDSTAQRNPVKQSLWSSPVRVRKYAADKNRPRRKLDDRLTSATPTQTISRRNQMSQPN